MCPLNAAALCEELHGAVLRGHRICRQRQRITWRCMIRTATLCA
jgi:hypothetical protein